MKNNNILTNDQIKNIKLNPWYVTGLIDAEGCFSVILHKTDKNKIGWRVTTRFQLGFHIRDLPL